MHTDWDSEHLSDIGETINCYLGQKSPDCILYSQNGLDFPIHKIYVLYIFQDLPCLKSRLEATDCPSLEEVDGSTTMRPLRRRQRQQPETEIKEEAAKSPDDYLPESGFEPAAIQVQTTCHHLPYNFFETKQDPHFEKSSKCYGSKSKIKNLSSSIMSVLSSVLSPASSSEFLNLNMAGGGSGGGGGSNLASSSSSSEAASKNGPASNIKSDTTSINHSSLPFLSLPTMSRLTPPTTLSFSSQHLPGITADFGPRKRLYCESPPHGLPPEIGPADPGGGDQKKWSKPMAATQPHNFFEAKPDLHFEKLSKCYGSKSKIKSPSSSRMSVLSSASLPASSSEFLNSKDCGVNDGSNPRRTTSTSPTELSGPWDSSPQRYPSAVKCRARKSVLMPFFQPDLILQCFFSFALISSLLVGSADAKRCSSMDIKHNVDRIKNLKGCSIIEGHLIISGFLEDQTMLNHTFPELREVTEYVIFYKAQNIARLNHFFPNLAVIRGNKLVADFALVIYQMDHMVEVGLTGLTHILKGGVRIEKNRNLCYVNTINWKSIVSERYHQNIHIEENEYNHLCPRNCPENCPELGTAKKRNCWSSKSCQIDPQNLRINHDRNEALCNQQCIGGCNGSSHLNCYACRNIMDVLSDGRKNCITQCPDGLLLYGNWRCISENECSEKVTHFNAETIDQERPYKIYERKCLEYCPPKTEELQKENNIWTCKECHDCSKECTGTTIRSLEALREFEGCTKISGDLTIQISGQNVVDELAKNLGQVSVITGTLKISRSFPIISLDFFKSLTEVQGIKSPDVEDSSQNSKPHYSLEILENENLQKLFPTGSKVKIYSRNGANGSPEKGRPFIHYNQKLCRKEIERLFSEFGMFDPGAISADISYGTNGHKSVCSEKTLNLTVQNLQNLAELPPGIPPGMPGLQLTFDNYQEELQANNVDHRKLLNYEIHYREIDEVTFSKKNVTKYGGRDACGNDKWMIEDHPPSPFTITEGLVTKWPIETSIITDGIKPFSYYAIFVTTMILRQGTTGDGGTQGEDIKSAASEIVYFQTPASFPEVPEDLQVTSVNYSTVNITWTEPKHPNGIIATYKIEIKHHKVNTDRLLSQVPYCDEEYAIKSESPKIDTEQPNTNPSNINKDKDSNEKGTCDCSSCGSVTGKGKDNGKGLSAREKEKLEEFQFQNDLINSVYQRVIPTFTSSNEDSKRKRRSLSSSDSNITNIVTGPKTKKSAAPTIIDYDSETDEAIEANEKQMTMTVYEKEVSGKERQLTIKDLKHFSKYTVTIKACHKPEEGRESHESMYCSQVKSYDFRTDKKEGADDIVGKIVSNQDKNNGTDVWITWQDPPDPNLAIVYYKFKFRLQHDTSKTLATCETAYDFIQKGRKFSPTQGSFYVSVRAVSLAGPGAWSEEILVTVGEDGSGLIMSIVIPIIVIIAFIVGLVAYIFYQRRRPAGDETTMNPIYWKRNFEGIEIPRDQIERGRELGTGSFGTVYAGIYNTGTRGDLPCAIKEAKNDTLREQLLSEADLMRTIDTPHVVQLLGVVTEGFPQFVVLELMENGDLKKYLRNLRRSPPKQNDILLMAIQVADGMAYLSTVPNPKIIHRDLAARNCMVNEKVIVKIGDFGLARDVTYAQDYYRMNGKDWLPVRWMSPESLRDSVFSSASDVWAYGVVLWEMVTLAEQPYQGLSNDEVLNFVKNRRTMEIPRNCPELIATLMQDCWAYEPEDRPSFVEICKRLQDYANDEFQRNSFITSALCKRILLRMQMPSGDVDDLPIDEAETKPLQANGGSNGNGEARGQLGNGHAVIPVSESINLRDFNGAGSNLEDSTNAGPLISHHRQHNMWERFRKILSRYQPAAQSLPSTAVAADHGETGSGERSSNHHHQTPTTVEA